MAIASRLKRIWDELPESGSCVDLDRALSIEEEIGRLTAKIDRLKYERDEYANRVKCSISSLWKRNEIAAAIYPGNKELQRRVMQAAKRRQRSFLHPTGGTIAVSDLIKDAEA